MAIPTLQTKLQKIFMEAFKQEYNVEKLLYYTY